VILAYPREIGQDGIVAISGSQEAFSSAEALFHALSSDIRYLGSSIGAAAALEVALLSYYVCTHLGLVQAALVCESEDVRTDLLASVIAESLPCDTEEIRNLGRALQESDFENPGASIGVYSGVLDRILEQARDASIDAEIASFANTLYKRGIDAGFANQEVVALIKLLRKTC
jgi:3-hydroxyisobutyrate dehydrogenase-like beta-hydroxyacid dehydrogenase